MRNKCTVIDVQRVTRKYLFLAEVDAHLFGWQRVIPQGAELHLNNSQGRVMDLQTLILRVVSEKYKLIEYFSLLMAIFKKFATQH